MATTSYGLARKHKQTKRQQKSSINSDISCPVRTAIFGKDTTNLTSSVQSTTPCVSIHKPMVEYSNPDHKQYKSPVKETTLTQP